MSSEDTPIPGPNRSRSRSRKAVVRNGAGSDDKESDHGQSRPKRQRKAVVRYGAGSCASIHRMLRRADAEKSMHRLWSEAEAKRVTAASRAARVPVEARRRADISFPGGGRRDAHADAGISALAVVSILLPTLDGIRFDPTSRTFLASDERVVSYSAVFQHIIGCVSFHR